MKPAWTITDGIHTLQTPQGTAFLCSWLNPSYTHGVIVHTDGRITHVPNTDWYASQDHMRALPGKPTSRGKHGQIYESSFHAARAFCEWKLAPVPAPEPLPETTDGLDLADARQALGLAPAPRFFANVLEVCRPSPACPHCSDSGVVETGNNDLPCEHCPKGDTAVFYVAGQSSPIDGAQLKANRRRGL